jgi:hypothetical protein
MASTGPLSTGWHLHPHKKKALPSMAAVPRQPDGGGNGLGPISKQGDHYLRRILIAVLRRAKENPGKYPWLTQFLARRPFKVVAVARHRDGQP